MDDENKHIELIIKHLCSETSSDEEQLLSNWINESKLNRKLYNETKKVWELSHEKIDPEVASIKLDDEWKQIESVIDFGKNTRVIDLKGKKSSSSYSWIRIAAIIIAIITIGGGLFYLTYQPETKLVAINNILEKKLPDGSTITLKEQSELSYDKEFNNEIRLVTLKGEAFFEVEPNVKKPFIVETGKLKVEVIGTSFLVKNAKAENISEVIVKSGKVLVYSFDNKSDSIVLHAGEKAIFDKEKMELNKTENLDENFIAWKTKIITFDNTSLIDVVAALNHIYNSNITITNKELEKCTLSVSFNNQSLESVLKVLKFTLDIQIKEQGNKIEISGDGCKNIQKE